MHQAWGEQESTPKTSLTIKESSRSGDVIKFRLFADGVPKPGSYSIVAWPVTQRGPAEVLKGVTLSSSGLAVCAGSPGTCGSPDKPDDPIDLNFKPVPGEPIRLGLVSSDGATKVFAKMVPIPLRGRDKNCSVEATLLTPGAELVLIHGSGFPASSEITVDSDSAGERISRKATTDAQGGYTTAILPAKPGVARGVVEVALKSGACSPAVSVPWGKRN